MKVTTLATAEKVPFNLDGKKMYTGLNVELVHLTLFPGEVLEKHSNPFDVVFYILQGTGVVETDENSQVVEPDMCFEIDMGVNRGVKNTGVTPLKFLVVKIL